MNVRNKIIKLSTESNEEVCGFLVGEDKIEVIPLFDVNIYYHLINKTYINYQYFYYKCNTCLVHL